MNVRKMMLIDRWVGVPLCFALTCLRPLWMRRSRPGGVRSILFIKLAEQGSTVLAHQALCDAVERVGRKNVFMMVFEDNRFILDLLEVIPPENVVPVRSDSLLSLGLSAGAALVRLRRIGIDAAIDLEFFARSSALLAALSGAFVRAGFHAYFGEGPYRGDLMTHRVRYNPHLHTTDSFASLVNVLDYPVEKLPQFNFEPGLSANALPSFAPTPREVAKTRAILEDCAGSPLTQPLLLLNANASDLIPLRRWDSARYVELARRLLEHFPEMRIAFTGAADEAAKVGALIGQVDSARCFSLAGRTTLRQLLVVYQLAHVLVTNDSGPAHFAALTSVHTVTLFGPETPLLFAAQTPRNTSLWAGIACSPCVSALNNRRSACRENVCMQRISVDQVFDAVCASYQAHRAMQPEAATLNAEAGR